MNSRRQRKPNEPEQQTSRQAQTEPPGATDVWTTLQQSIGNAALGRMVESRAKSDIPEEEEIPAATMPEEEEPVPTAEMPEEEEVPTAAMPEEEEKTDEEPAPAVTSGTVEELPDEQPVPKEDGASVVTKHSDASGPVPPRGRVPIQAVLSLDSDVHETQGPPAAGAVVKDDAIAGTLTMASSVNEKQTAWGSDTAFGEEEVEYKVDSGTWKAEGGKVNVSGRVFLDIGWKTRSRDRTNVSGPADPAITAGTWSPIMADLQPDATGRPTRKEYWAQDLTQKHELFHATDDIDRAKLYLPTAQAWLNTQTITDPSNAAATSTEVGTLLESVRAKVKADGWAWYGAGGENRAYNDGKPSYEDRVNQIGSVTAQEGFA